MRTDNSRVYLVGNLEITKMYKKRCADVNILQHRQLVKSNG